MYNILVHGYRPGRAAVRNLRRMFGYRRQRYPTHIINWGDSDYPVTTEIPLYNKPEAVRTAINKIEALRVLAENDVPCVLMTTNIDVAREWQARGYKLFERHLTRASEGRGIIVKSIGDELNANAKFWTRYFPARHEFRIHVAFGNVIRVQQKKRPNGTDTCLIRNYDNGYRYSTNLSIDVPDDVLRTAAKAVSTLGLDFGAVDMLYMPSRSACRVLEVNTAPAIENDTLVSYYTAFMKEITNA